MRARIREQGVVGEPLAADQPAGNADAEVAGALEPQLREGLAAGAEAPTNGLFAGRTRERARTRLRPRRAVAAPSRTPVRSRRGTATARAGASGSWPGGTRAPCVHSRPRRG